MLNKCLFIGHVGADPEIRSTQNGKRIANMRLAVTEKWRDGDGNRKEKTEWVSVVIFSEGLCKIVEAYVKKGSKIYIEGALQTRKWQDQAGNDRYSTEVVLQGFNCALTLLDSPRGEDKSSGDYGKASGREQAKKPERDSYGNDPDPFDDTIPF
ncbi:single-strand DNA-binding protein [Shinella sp. BE166]|uniref:single-stranded DNA-binding protein n=1 Tax=Shinella sp. BE166 TaxID=3373918 RepID=UPI003EB87611